MTTPSQLKRFTHPLTWTGGGSHGLSIRYRDPSPARLRAARDALWSFPGLDGCWRRSDREPSAAARLASTWGLDASQPLYGLAGLPGTLGVACQARAWADDHGASDDCPLCRELARHAGPPVGWLSLLLPFGALGLAYPLGKYPVADGTSLAWRAEVDGWLRGLAAHVHREVPFELAVLGWMDGADLLPTSAAEVPEERSLGYLFPEGTGLAWFPPTTGAPFDEDLLDLDLDPTFDLAS
ncbi:MAG: hypothetical protein NDI82_03440 [Anaeromyxobacteraceae bacterium]|nr:hypothetical protein [Anaeromyxobacteraceae bacterium]